jgi:(heptosyl)LPS beta-1,4-glucosyltransferase
MAIMMRLTAVVLTYNEADHIAECLQSVQFADRRVVFDSFSSDQTVEIAQSAGATVLQHAFENYAAQRNAALEAVAGYSDWVLFVDADERVTPELAAEVRELIEQPDYAGFQIPRFNYIFGHLTRGAGWYPDYQTRLLRIGKAHYDPLRKVHEVVELEGRLGATSQHFIHYNYRDLSHFLNKQRKYVRYDAGIMFEQGIRPKLRNYILQPLRHFYWRFVRLQGYRDGWHGLVLSALMAWYEWRKYWILGRLWKETGSI